jgi:phospholipid/cholesterol/gamma-HCH transport system permease protein
VDGGAGAKLSLSGRFAFEHVAETWTELRRHLDAAKRPDGAVVFDLVGVTAMDSGTMALLVHIRDELAAQGIAADFLGGPESVEALVHLHKGDVAPLLRVHREAEGVLSQIGRVTIEMLVETQGVLAFLGTMVLAFLGLLKEPKTGNWREVVPIMERTGADAVPIVVLINFLVGFVMGFQGANQLKQFGANIYVADLVGLSVTRELGPLMTAIILCGRSGAAFAAELGSMKVSEEIDALRTMGFGPMRYLVLPRTIALVFVLPVLTLIGDFVGIVGGLVVGMLSLDLTLVGYLSETRKALVVWDVSSGLIKSVVFALAIALISCQQGFATTGGAEGVGRRTTSSVVTILFALIIIDAGFTMFFHTVHL